VLDDNRAHLCFTVVAAEVQALKAEVGILKQSFEEERRAHKAGDFQLQKVLELEKIRRAKLDCILKRSCPKKRAT